MNVKKEGRKTTWSVEKKKPESKGKNKKEAAKPAESTKEVDNG